MLLSAPKLFAKVFAHGCSCFVTATCNPKWPEFKELLYNDGAGHSVQDCWSRPDMVVRVWEQKKKELMHDLLDKEACALASQLMSSVGPLLRCTGFGESCRICALR